MGKFVVAVCSCPAGVAHTYMAADKLADTARKMGYECKVETQGMAGIEDRLTIDDLRRADAILMCNEVALREPERFEGFENKMFHYSVSHALHHAAEVLKESLEG